MMTRRQAQGRSTHGVNKRPSLPKAPVEQSKPNKKKNATVKGPSAKTKTSGSLAKTQTSGSSSGSKRPSYSSTLSSSPLPTPTGSRMVPTSSKTATGSKIPLPTPTSSKMAKEIDALKQLNADLIQRLKSIEEELKSTKQLCDELLANSSAPAPVLSVPELNLEHEHTPPEPSPALPPPDTHDHDTRNPYLLVCGDSMTRDFGEILQRLLPHYSVLSHTLPGASLSSVLNDLPSLAKNFNKKDIVFVLAGTNDVPLLSPDRLEHEFQRLSTLTQSTNLIFSSIPYRFDTKKKHNTNIFATNLYIMSRSHVYSYHYFDCNFFLNRGMYTRHGLHFNKPGKQHLCNKISNSLYLTSQNKRSILMPELGNLSGQPSVFCDKLILDITCPPLLLGESLLDFTNSEPAAADINTQANTSVNNNDSNNSSLLFLENY